MKQLIRIGAAFLAVTVLLPALFGAAAEPPAPRRIYLALDDHTDYMWTADEQTFRKAFVESLDYYLDLAEKTAAAPAPYQSRFNCDGSLWVWAYEQEKSPEQLARLMGRVRSGHITVPLNTMVCCYGAMPTEAVLRSMYYAGTLERRFDVRLRLAMALENQTMPCGLGSLWAGSGARYTWQGICNCATRVPDPVNRRHPLYWWVGLDGQRILTKWYPMLGSNQSIGGYAEARRPEEAVQIVENSAVFRVRHPYPVIGIFGKGWDDLQTRTDEFPKLARRLSNENRQVIVSNEIDFFQDVERTCGDQLPELTCSFGNEWELNTASLAESTSRVRRAVERLRRAEAMAALVSMARPRAWQARSAERRETMIRFAMYFEHCFGASGPVALPIRRKWHRRLAGEIEQYVNSLHNEMVAELGQLIRGDEGCRRLFVFNPLGWPRTDTADVPIDDDQPLHVVHVASGEEVPSQRITDAAGRPVLRFLAGDVPPVGYSVFEVRPGPGASFSDAALVDDRVIENEFYRIKLAASGALESLIDKTRGGREFAGKIDGRTVNDLGGGPSGKLEISERGPVSVTLRAISSEPLAHETRITLARASRRIEIHNEIQQNFGDVRYWSFSFALPGAVMRHEELGAILTARLVSDGGHYADQNARYDHLTLNHFADLTGDGVGVTLSNADCSFVRFGRSTIRRLDTATPQFSVLAGGQVDGPGFADQGGDERFVQRFALTTHDEYDPYDAMRFALEHQNPFVVGPVTPDGRYPSQQGSLMKELPRPLVLWAVKPAEEGIEHGLMLRIWNISGQSAGHRLAMPFPVERAAETSHLETDIRAVKLSDGAMPIRLSPWRMRTWRLVGNKTNSSTAGGSTTR